MNKNIKSISSNKKHYKLLVNASNLEKYQELLKVKSGGSGTATGNVANVHPWL